MRRITAETYDACATEWETYLRERFPNCRWALARYADLEANDLALDNRVDRAYTAIRMSMGRFLTNADIERATNTIIYECNRLMRI